MIVTRVFTTVSLIGSVTFGLSQINKSDSKRTGTIMGIAFAIAFACTIVAIQLAQSSSRIKHPDIALSLVAFATIICVWTYELEPKQINK